MLLSPTFFKNPINQTKSTDAADAFDKPILTLASLRRGTTNVQTNGLPTDNKTTLGLYRFPGNDIGALSGGVGQPAIPPVAPVFKAPSISFTSVGNNVFQPTGSTLATNALLKRVGEQQFKAKENEPYAAYMAMAKLEREVGEAEKGASVNDLNLAREILRSAMAERRKQNEDDYLRKMLDSGMSAEDAKDELDEVRRANALQESRKVDDRSYQSKLLLVNLAKKRGITANVNEPLTQTAPIMNPSPSDAMATAMGDPSQGFGNAPLDVNRQFLTPEYYGRFMRKSRMTEEDVDRQTAMNNLVASGSETQTPLMLDAKRREIAMENIAESLAASLSSIRQRAILEPLPPSLIAEDLYTTILKAVNKKPLQNARMVDMDFESMTEPQLIVALNRALAENGQSGIVDAKRTIADSVLAVRDSRADRNSLVLLCQNITGSDSGKTISISGLKRVDAGELTTALRMFVGKDMATFKNPIAAWIKSYEAITADKSGEPKLRSEPQSDTKKNLYFSNVAPARTPIKQISEDYGIGVVDALRFGKAISQARREQLDARNEQEQANLSKARAVKLLREYAKNKKAQKAAKDMAEIEEMEGAVASMTRAKRLPRPRKGGKTTVTFSRPEPSEMRATGPSPASQIDKVRMSKTREQYPVPETENKWNALPADTKNIYSRAYSIPMTLSRKQQYEYLVANFRG